VQTGARTRRAVQGGDLGLLAFLIEAVIERTVDDGVEASVVSGQFGGVGYSERDRDASL